mmetsp:Transcript_56497/g.168147  ORF Transcript_56497/g.168147 Transcript_56497/m.168147 type:complete len:175 (+) Transcript_56497:119-643(+)
MVQGGAPHEWFGQTFSADQDHWIIACIVMLAVIGTCVVCWVSDVYRLLPGWGPIRKFDNAGQEDMRTKQALIHEHTAQLQAARVQRPQEERHDYGAIGPPTWGVCESPNKSTTPIFHPVYGYCKIREGFADTQRMREESEWWAKDEPYLLAKKGLRPPVARINGYYSEHSGRMV